MFLIYLSIYKSRRLVGDESFDVFLVLEASFVCLPTRKLLSFQGLL